MRALCFCMGTYYHAVVLYLDPLGWDLIVGHSLVARQPRQPLQVLVLLRQPAKHSLCGKRLSVIWHSMAKLAF